MENMSILNLFSAKANISLPKMTDTSSGQFEDVFKSYLDRSAGDQHSLKADTAANDQTSVKAEEPETPEEVIDSLDISEDQKAELKKKLEEADTAEEAEEFVQSLVEAAGEDAEEILSQLALSLLSADAVSEDVNSLVLEETLDQIVEIQNRNNQPHLTLVKDNSEIDADEETSSEDGEADAQTAELLMDDSEGELSEELKEKLAAIIAKDGTAKTTVTDNNEGGFTIRAESTEKVLTTEIKIEGPRDIMKFADMMELAKGQKVNKLEIQLHPQELGKVTIELSEQAGKVSGKVVFESETARNLFVNNAEGLRQQLIDKGVLIENLEFTFKEFNEKEFAGKEGEEGKNNGNGSSAFFDTEEDAEEQDEAGGVYA